MKRKVVLLSLALMLVTVGVVSAAANWGQFKGYNIVRLVIDGKAVTPKDTPPVILEGRTMVPIAMLEEAGLKATWDKDTYTVEVSGNQSSSGSDLLSYNKSFIKKLKDTGKQVINIRDASINYDEISSYLNVQLNIDNRYSAESYYIAPTLLAGSYEKGLDYLKIDLFDRNSLTMSMYVYAQAISDYGKELIDEMDLIGQIDIVDHRPSSGSVVSPGTGSTGTTNTTITSKMKDTFEGFEEGNLYELDNGQIWKQTSYDYKYAYKYRPDVVIYKDGVNWYMSVDGVDKHVKVEKIK
jgi:hypothetical protein